MHICIYVYIYTNIDVHKHKRMNILSHLLKGADCMGKVVHLCRGFVCIYICI